MGLPGEGSTFPIMRRPRLNAASPVKEILISPMLPTPRPQRNTMPLLLLVLVLLAGCRSERAAFKFMPPIAQTAKPILYVGNIMSMDTSTTALAVSVLAATPQQRPASSSPQGRRTRVKNMVPAQQYAVSMPSASAPAGILSNRTSDSQTHYFVPHQRDAETEYEKSQCRRRRIGYASAKLNGRNSGFATTSIKKIFYGTTTKFLLKPHQIVSENTGWILAYLFIPIGIMLLFADFALLFWLGIALLVAGCLILFTAAYGGKIGG